MRPYYQRDIYRCLAKHGPMSTIEITKQIGLPYWPGTNHPTRVGTQSIFKMKAAGLVRRAGAKWEIVPGTRAPKDKRGHAEGSKLALRSHSRNNMAKMRARKGYHVKPVATTALEQAWGWLPSISPCLTADNETCANNGGAVRPQESEAA